MTDQRDYGDENDACTCRKYATDPRCPRHGVAEGQLTLDQPEAQPGFYDPATAPFPPGF